MLPPPHNGIGTEEDSLGSFLYLMPKVPKQDFKKLMENDGIQLRYLARFVDPQIEDKDRRFIITFYLNNDSVSCFEKFERNSGFIGGKFFERARAKNPATGEYFRATDFGVGKIIEFNKHKFEIIEGDEYTLQYMRKNFSPEAEAEKAAAAAAAAAANADHLNTSGDAAAEGSPKGSPSPGKGSKAGGVLASAGKSMAKSKFGAHRSRVAEMRAAGAAPRL